MTSMSSCYIRRMVECCLALALVLFAKEYLDYLCSQKIAEIVAITEEGNKSIIQNGLKSSSQYEWKKTYLQVQQQHRYPDITNSQKQLHQTTVVASSFRNQPVRKKKQMDSANDRLKNMNKLVSSNAATTTPTTRQRTSPKKRSEPRRQRVRPEIDELLQIKATIASTSSENNLPVLANSMVNADPNYHTWIPVSQQERSVYDNGCQHQFKHCCIGQGRKLEDKRIDVEPLYQKWSDPNMGDLFDVLKFLGDHQNEDTDSCNIWMIGDSLTSDHAVAAMCDLTQMRYTMVECVKGFGGPTWGEDHLCISAEEAEYSFPHFSLERAAAKGGKCHKVVIRFTNPITLNDKRLERLESEPDAFIEQGGVIMYNFGVHCNTPGCITEFINDSFVSFMDKVNTLPAVWDVVWRETEPQHFNTPGGLYEFGAARGHNNCVAQSNLNNFRNEEAKAALSNVGYGEDVLPIIPIFNALSPRADFHSDTSGDCTHYVYTPWRFALTWDGLAKGLERIIG